MIWIPARVEHGDGPCPHVLGDYNDPRIETGRPRSFPRAVIAYAILCIVAVIFVIANAFLLT